MEDKQAVGRIIALLGGADNIVCLTNCMTRLRVTVKDEGLVQQERLKGADRVMGLVHDGPCSFEVVVGPGTSRKFADICRAMGISTKADQGADWRANKAAVDTDRKSNPLKNGLKMLSDIFVPLIPGIITAGLCAGFASLITQLVPDYQDQTVWNLAYQLLTLVNMSFMTYITAWAGYRAAERFGATPILGGMLGLITSLAGINQIAMLLGLYDEEAPLSSVLQSGKGGVLAVIFGVFVLSLVEKAIRKRMPTSLDVVFTSLLSLLICVVPYILVIMPVFGYISGGVAWALGQACMSGNVFVRAVVGYVAAAVFLPMVACGMHHGMVALYSLQLQELGYVTLYPALAMAGAGQVGAAIALYVKARRLRHTKLCSVIAGSLPAGFLGVGEPLIYGVTLPMGRPFLTAGLGAGFGGAFVTICQVASTTWGPSGLLGLFVMTAGQGGAVRSIAMYAVGLLVSYVASFFITSALISDNDVAQALGGVDEQAAEPGDSAVPAGARVRHGDPVLLDCAQPPQPAGGAVDEKNAALEVPQPLQNAGSQAQGAQARCVLDVHERLRNAAPEVPPLTFEHVVRDEVGLHARPAAELAKLASQFDADVTLANGSRTATAASVIELMLLGAVRGSRLQVRVSGREAERAASALRRFMDERL